MDPARKTQERHSALDGLRGIAALSVLLFHLWLYARISPGPGSAMNAADWAWSSARLGLVLFFVVSGFLLYRPWLEAAVNDGEPPELWRYLRSRAARILPAYYVALAGAMLLVFGLSSTPGVRLPSPDSLPLFLVFAQNLSPGSLLTLDPPMWTLAVEVSFYLALPVIGLAALRLGRGRRPQAVMPLALLGGGILWNATISAHTGPLTKVLPALLPFFAIGMLAALYRLDRQIGKKEGRLLLLAGVVAIAAEVATQIAVPHISSVTHGLLAACGFAALAILASSSQAPRLLSRPALAWLGTISYGIYLWNVPLLWWLRGHNLLPLHPVIALPVVLGLTLPAAAASWFLVERPAIAWARRSGRARPAPRRSSEGGRGHRLSAKPALP